MFAIHRQFVGFLVGSALLATLGGAIAPTASAVQTVPSTVQSASEPAQVSEPNWCSGTRIRIKNADRQPIVLQQFQYSTDAKSWTVAPGEEITFQNSNMPFPTDDVHLRMWRSDATKEGDEFWIHADNPAIGYPYIELAGFFDTDWMDIKRFSKNEGHEFVRNKDRIGTFWGWRGDDSKDYKEFWLTYKGK